MTTIIAFFHEMFLRLVQSSPKFARRLQWFAGILNTIILAMIATAAASGWGWDALIINLVIFKISLSKLLASFVVMLTGVFVGAKTAVEDVRKLSKKVMDKAPSA